MPHNGIFCDVMFSVGRLEAKLRSINFFYLTRFDHFQMGPSVVVSVYAKLCDPQKCFVEANYTCVSALVIMDYNEAITLHVYFYLKFSSKKCVHSNT